MNLVRPKCRIVIVDDHTLFREGLRTILEMEEDIEVVADAENAEDIVRRSTCVPSDWVPRVWS